MRNPKCPVVTLLSVLVTFCLWQPARADVSRAVNFGVVYTADVMSNLSGGIDRGTRYMDNLDVMLEIDAERALGWTGGTIFLYGLYNNGVKFSETLVGDTQVASNIETGVQAFRLYEAWVEQSIASERASLRFGLYDLNSEFDAIETAGLFLNSSHGIGADFAQSGINGPSIFPLTSLGARVNVSLSDTLTLRAVVLDGVPGSPDHPKRTAIRLGGGDGALLAADLDYTGAAFRAAAGYWRYTASFEDQMTGDSRGGNDGVYGFIEGSFDRLAVFARAGWASAGLNPIKYYLGVGAVYAGPLPSRPDDELGLAVALAESGAPFRGLNTADDREVSVELTYRAPLGDYFTVQPDIQYIFNPGFAPDLRNALVVGLRLELAWGN